uniref:Wzy n=1 Tax=Streptococcus suis TaxID=1307 RepID=A0A2H4H6E5_STRSU|nr:Wzy [Streptococcus suis]
MFNILLLFFYIFSFSFYNGGFFDSALLVLIFLSIHIIINQSYRKMVQRYISTKYFVNIFLLYIVLNIWFLIILFINDSVDFTFLKTFANMFQTWVTGGLLFQYYCVQNKEKEIVNHLMIVFAVQTLIQWLAFSVPSIKTLINYTKSYSTILKGMSYSGIRANALSGSSFFGLSAAYAIILILFVSNKNQLFVKKPTLKFGLFLFILTGGFFAGRTTFMGLFIAIIVFLCVRKFKPTKEQILSVSVGIPSLFVMLFILNSYFGKLESIINLKNFAFQFFYKYSTQGTIVISSVESLLEMYFIPELSTWLVGDGKYSVATGYYMSTDVGYLRVILFGGVLSLLVLFTMQFLLMQVNKGKEKFIKISCLIALLMLNLKGEVIFWSQNVLAIITIFCLQDLFTLDRKSR